MLVLHRLRAGHCCQGSLLPFGCRNRLGISLNDRRVYDELQVGPMEIPEWLTSATSLTRRDLQFQSSTPAWQAAVEAIQDRVDREQTFLTNELKGLPGDTPATGQQLRSRQADKSHDSLRKETANYLAEMEDRLQLENERLIQPLGGLSHLVRDTANRIRVEDLSREVSSQSIKLKLLSHQVSSYNRKLVDALQGQLRADLGRIDNALSDLEGNVADQRPV